MTKRHFEEFARLIKQAGVDEGGSDKGESLETRQYAAYLVSRVAREFNPRFDRGRFYRAAGLGEY